MCASLFLGLLAAGSALELRPLATPRLRPACAPRAAVRAEAEGGDAPSPLDGPAAASPELTPEPEKEYASLLGRANIQVWAGSLCIWLAVLAVGFGATGGRGGLDNPPLVNTSALSLSSLMEKQVWNASRPRARRLGQIAWWEDGPYTASPPPPADRRSVRMRCAGSDAQAASRVRQGPDHPRFVRGGPQVQRAVRVPLPVACLVAAGANEKGKVC